MSYANAAFADKPETVDSLDDDASEMSYKLASELGHTPFTEGLREYMKVKNLANEQAMDAIRACESESDSCRRDPFKGCPACAYVPRQQLSTGEYQCA